MYDRRYFNGIGYVPFYVADDLDTDSAAGYIGELGAVCVRLWAQFRYLLEAPDKINEKNAGRLHREIAALRKNGVKLIIPVNHDWFVPDKEGKPKIRCGPFPPRNSEMYEKVMGWFEESWKTVAREFDEVDGWETGNEANHIPFLHALYGEEFDLMQKADICTDMMFRAARAIRSVSDGKIIVMPGMAPIGGDKIGIVGDNIAETEYGGMTQTLDRIYKNIESGEYGSTDPRDFFDKLCWHTYYVQPNERGEWVFTCPDEKWVELNKGVYAVAQAHGDTDVGCYISEYGFNDEGIDERDEKYASYLVEGYRLAKEKMPFIESIQAYRIFSYINEPGVWDEYGLCDGKVTPPRKKKKFYELKKYFSEN